MPSYIPDCISSIPPTATDPVSAALRQMSAMNIETPEKWAKVLSATASDLSKLAGRMARPVPHPHFAKNSFSGCLSILSSQEIEVLEKVSGHGYPETTVTDIAKEKGVSRERISQIRLRAIAKLKAALPESQHTLLKVVFNLNAKPAASTSFRLEIGTLSLSLADLYCGVTISGEAGSGKTEVTKELTARLIEQLSGPEDKVGGLLLGVKGEYVPFLIRQLSIAKRLDDLVLLSTEGDHRLDIVHAGFSIEEEVVSIRDFAVNCCRATGLHAHGMNQFEVDVTSTTIASIYALLRLQRKLNGDGKKPSLSDINAVLALDPDQFGLWLQLDGVSSDRAQGIPGLVLYRKECDHLRNLSRSYINTARTVISQFVAPEFERVFGSNDADTFDIADVPNEGKFVAMDRDDSCDSVWSKCINAALLSRFRLALAKSEGVSRTSLLVLDEQQPDLETIRMFPAQGRSYRVVTVFATQTISGRCAGEPDPAYFAYFSTHVFLRNSDVQGTGLFMETKGALRSEFRLFAGLREASTIKPLFPRETIAQLRSLFGSDKVEAVVVHTAPDGIKASRSYINLDSVRRAALRE